MNNSYWKLDFQKIVFDYSPGIQRFLSNQTFRFEEFLSSFFLYSTGEIQDLLIARLLQLSLSTHIFSPQFLAVQGGVGLLINITVVNILHGIYGLCGVCR
jgi:hypothetical protein